ncbi:MAG TPA: TIGR03862 family flavoprotein [Chthoniobacteraceae bacterium]
MQIAIVGGGPAGLRAAEVAATGGAAVTLFDAKASVGRKFLVAGRGGLNLTKEESPELFASHYSGPNQPPQFWSALIAEFGPEALRKWAADLGTETFVASTGRVYPRELKAAPLLRRWLQRLRERDVRFAMHHRWTGLQPEGARWRSFFQTPDGDRYFDADAVILALGGGSWPETGSNGHWTTTLTALGVDVSPLAPANCGWETNWSMEALALGEGKPLKNIVARVGNEEAAGELLFTKYGLEGGAIYKLGAALRAMDQPAMAIDLKPSLSVDQLVARLGPIRRNFLAEARSRWRLSDAAFAVLINLAAVGSIESGAAIAALCKKCVVPLQRPRSLAEAISSAGGVKWTELDDSLMLKRLPRVFVAGEMIDWEAPTGGYLMQGCFASGGHAARAALAIKNSASE